MCVLDIQSSVYCTNPLTQAVKEKYKREGAYKVHDFPVMIDRNASKICLNVLPDSSWEVTSRVSPPEVCKRHIVYADDLCTAISYSFSD